MSVNSQAFHAEPRRESIVSVTFGKGSRQLQFAGPLSLSQQCGHRISHTLQEFVCCGNLLGYSLKAIPIKTVPHATCQENPQQWSKWRLPSTAEMCVVVYWRTVSLSLSDIQTQRRMMQLENDSKFLRESSDDQHQWPPREPDLTPHPTPDFILSGYLKRRLFRNTVPETDALPEHIINKIRQTDNTILRSTTATSTRALAENGGYFWHTARKFFFHMKQGTCLISMFHILLISMWLY